MSRSASQTLVFLALLIYSTGSLGSNLGVGEPKIRCKEVERQALLRIKEDIYNSSYGSGGILSSWGNEEEKRECCEWSGIRCHNKSGHVVKLDLSPSTYARMPYEHTDFFIGNMSSSLVDLRYLKHLDLSCNFVDGNFIPRFIGGLTRLRYLNLSYTWLEGEIPPQLGNLSNLQYLDLSYNKQLKIKGLQSISRLSSLRVLDLSSTNMSIAHDWVHVVNNLPHLTDLKLSDSELRDMVPPSLSLVNSSKFLAVLDLSENLLSASVFQWLFNYSRSLVHLNLFHCLSKTYLPEAFGNLAALESLYLAGNDLEGSIPISFGKMTALTHLDLRGGEIGYDPRSNRLGGPIPKSFGNITALVQLDLSGNQLEGSIPEGFGTMNFLQYLDLSNNMLSGEIPKSIWKICALQEFHAYNNSLSGELHFAESTSRGCVHFPLEILDLGMNRIVGSLPNFTLYQSLKEFRLNSNQLNGNLSKSLGQLSKLEVLHISDNSMADVMTEVHFLKLFNLSHLDLSSNSHIVFDVSSDWIPPFQLAIVELGGCKLGPYFPKWLLTQNSMSTLNISNSGISDSIPYTLWNHLISLRTLDLSDNEFKGKIQDYQGPLFSPLDSIDLSSNHLEGPIPPFLLQVKSLNLFNNKFSDINSLCNCTPYGLELVFLDVSYNQLSGELPDCWSQAGPLQVLVLGSNKLSGKIPTSIGLLTGIEILHLGKNSFTAELPSSLQNCTELVIFDVGENKLSGQTPTWIGNSLTKLVILSLRSNNFNGSMPSELCHLVHLQLLDLSSNKLSSSIPNCLGNITALRATGGTDSAIREPYQQYSRGWDGIPSDFYNERLFLVWKGVVREFKNLGLLKNIDLSSNKLSGDIPKEITRLIGLVSLNLSRNNLSGQIPQEIGELKSLDALDLSKNHLFGRIPSSLSQVDRLNTLDLSSNNLSGKIPSGTQLQSRDPAAYLGNPELCGAPLSKKCPGEEEPAISKAIEDDVIDDEQDEFITEGCYISIAVGFIVGFWGFCLTFIINKSWRYRYLKLLNNAGDSLYITVATHKAKLLTGDD
ncbi:receptor-like protein EIX2 [Morus notabilis]|uniref:receptor-like protein EIX2 n=1 Tax=Morus notabilis TaxID=981085 RepID=UPI000CECFE39|nr:receptor-like protein EIX2 [Morus notabilis]